MKCECGGDALTGVSEIREEGEIESSCPGLLFRVEIRSFSFPYESNVMMMMMLVLEPSTNVIFNLCAHTWRAIRQPPSNPITTKASNASSFFNHRKYVDI